MKKFNKMLEQHKRRGRVLIDARAIKVNLVYSDHGVFVSPGAYLLPAHGHELVGVKVTYGECSTLIPAAYVRAGMVHPEFEEFVLGRVDDINDPTAVLTVRNNDHSDHRVDIWDGNGVNDDTSFNEEVRKLIDALPIESRYRRDTPEIVSDFAFLRYAASKHYWARCAEGKIRAALGEWLSKNWTGKVINKRLITALKKSWAEFMPSIRAFSPLYDRQENAPPLIPWDTLTASLDWRFGRCILSVRQYGQSPMSLHPLGYEGSINIEVVIYQGDAEKPRFSMENATNEVRESERLCLPDNLEKPDLVPLARIMDYARARDEARKALEALDGFGGLPYTMRGRSVQKYVYLGDIAGRILER